jgi:hypothetical protein
MKNVKGAASVSWTLPEKTESGFYPVCIDFICPALINGWQTIMSVPCAKRISRN